MSHSVTQIKMQQPPLLFSATVTYITDLFPCHIKFQTEGRGVISVPANRKHSVIFRQTLQQEYSVKWPANTVLWDFLPVIVKAFRTYALPNYKFLTILDMLY